MILASTQDELPLQTSRGLSTPSRWSEVLADSICAPRHDESPEQVIEGGGGNKQRQVARLPPGVEYLGGQGQPDQGSPGTPAAQRHEAGEDGRQENQQEFYRIEQHGLAPTRAGVLL